MFWYRRYEIHSPSPPQVLVFLVNLTQISQPAKTVKFSEESSCFVPDINGHRTSCKKPEICEISKSHSTTFSFGIPMHLRMSKKLAIFQLTQNTQLNLQQQSDAKTKHSYLPSITIINNLFGPFKQQDASPPPLLLPLVVMYSTTRRKQCAD